MKKVIYCCLVIVLISIIGYKYLNQDVKAPVLEKGVNDYVYKEMSERTNASIYFNEYILLLLTDEQKAYNMLTKESKARNKFDSLEKFTTFINNNKNKLNVQKLKEYRITNNNGVKSYICTAEDGYIYIFTLKSVKDYNVDIKIP